MDGHRMA